MSDDKIELITKSKHVKLEEMKSVNMFTTAGADVKTKIMARGKAGKFARKEGVKIDPRALTIAFREAMLKTDSETGLSDLQEFYLSLCEIIKRPLEDTDPKAALAAVKAYEALMSRVWGKPDPSDDALEAKASGAVKVIILNQQPTGKPLEVQPVKKLLPSFAEVTDIKTNS
jgi:hypothetical protein